MSGHFWEPCRQSPGGLAWGSVHLSAHGRLESPSTRLRTVHWGATDPAFPWFSRTVLLHPVDRVPVLVPPTKEHEHVLGRLFPGCYIVAWLAQGADHHWWPCFLFFLSLAQPPVLAFSFLQGHLLGNPEWLLFEAPGRGKYFLPGHADQTDGFPLVFNAFSGTNTAGRDFSGRRYFHLMI